MIYVENLIPKLISAATLFLSTKVFCFLKNINDKNKK